MRVALRLGRVTPIGGHEKDVDVRTARTDHLLLHAADLSDGAVGQELARRGDPMTAVDVPARLLEQFERERETRGRTADAAEVELGVAWQSKRVCLAQEDPDERVTGVVRIG